MLENRLKTNTNFTGKKLKILWIKTVFHLVKIFA